MTPFLLGDDEEFDEDFEDDDDLDEEDDDSEDEDLEDDDDESETWQVSIAPIAPSCA